MKIDIKKDWKFYGILTIAVLIIVLIANYALKIEEKLYTAGEVQEETGTLEEIATGTEIIQTFVAVDNNLEKVKIDFEPYKDDVNCGGKVTIGIKDADGNVIEEKEILRNYVRETSQYTLEFSKQKDSKDKEYQIFIRFNDLEEADKFYSVKYTDKNEFLKNHLTVNGEEMQRASLIFQDLYKSNIRTTIYSVILIVFVLGIYIVSSIIYYKKGMKIENIFLMVAPLTCIFFLVTMPTFKNHDEYYHWLKAYEVSQGTLMTPQENGVQGSMMPEGVSKVFPTDWTKLDYQMMKGILDVKLNEDNKGILNPETAAVYSFVQYIPQATGIALARLVTDNVYLITYGGRIVNMIFALLVLYFAIKLMPFGKKLLLIPAMIPIAIEGFTSLSPDAMTISVAFFYIAYILHLAFGEKEQIGIKEKAILLISSIVIALCKIVYIPLVGLILIIPKEKFKNQGNKNKILNFCVIAGIAVMINLIWLAISSRYLSTFREGDSKIQVLLALQNPILYIQNVLYTFNLNGSNYLLSLFGADLGWGELIKLYSIVPYAFLGIYLFTAITDNELKDKFKRYQIVWISLVVLAIVGLIFTSLYVQWTTVGQTSIAGIQGRYFLPILPLVMLLLGSVVKVKSLYNEEKVTKFVGISILVLQIFTISQILVEHL